MECEHKFMSEHNYIDEDGTKETIHYICAKCKKLEIKERDIK